MKLYYALFDGWQLPGQQSKDAQRVDLPSSPAEMAAWLNTRGVTMTARPKPFPALLSEPELLDAQGFSAPPAEPTVRASRDSLTVTAAEIEQFILDGATVAEVERIFAALGTRFAEARR